MEISVRAKRTGCEYVDEDHAEDVIRSGRSWKSEEWSPGLSGCYWRSAVARTEMYLGFSSEKEYYQSEAVRKPLFLFAKDDHKQYRFEGELPTMVENIETKGYIVPFPTWCS